MFEFKGTQGKWQSTTITDRGLISIACFGYDDNLDDDFLNNKYSIAGIWSLSDEAKANALLISKAPEMLQMLENILDCQDAECHLPNDINDCIIQLIKEATNV
jgi:hypothetical protein